MPLPALSGLKCVAVVAHPDDECLFSAGAVLTLPCEWTVICCSIPRLDPIRALKFYDACSVLGARAVVLPCVESSPLEKLSCLEWLDLNAYDIIFTHNKKGEYGHKHHIQVHDFIMSKFSGKRIFTFGYDDERNDSLYVGLNADQLALKTSALQCYNHTMPYKGVSMPKCEALIDRYFQGKWEHLAQEVYNEHRA